MMQQLGFAQNGLGGISVHPDYVLSYKNWMNETAAKREADEVPRTFSQYIIDPNDDVNTGDSLEQTSWWANRSRPGWDPEFATMQYERALMENGPLSYWGSKIVQPQFIRTSAEDYFPDWMNIFTKENGERVRSYDLVSGDEVTDVFIRGGASAGLALGNILIGGLVAGAAGYVVLKLANKNVDDIIKLPFTAVSGLISGTAELAGTLARQFTKKGDFVESLKGESLNGE